MHARRVPEALVDALIAVVRADAVVRAAAEEAISAVSVSVPSLIKKPLFCAESRA